MSLLSSNILSNVKDFVQKKDRKVEENSGGASGAAGNAGAFVLSDAIKSNKEQLETKEKKSEEKDWMAVPKGFYDFIQRPNYYNFLEALLEYCRELFRLENKQQVLEVEAKQRGLAVPQVLPSEKKKLHEKAKRLANMYAWIVFSKKSIPDGIKNCESSIMFKSKIEANQMADQNFYETLMLFSMNTLEMAFEKQDLLKLQDEISRLFRSNAFNVVSRTAFDKQRNEKFPCLQAPQIVETNEARNKRLEARAKVPREPYEIKKNDIRPLYHKQTPHGSVLSRSPMISMIFPSFKDKIRQFKHPINMDKPAPRAKSSANTMRLNMGAIIENESIQRGIGSSAYQRRIPSGWRI